jgi:predicted DNA-binding protein
VKHLFIELDDEMHRKLKAKCYSEGKTITQTIRLLIEKYVNGEISL